MHGGWTMRENSEVFVAFDVAKKKHAVAIAERAGTGKLDFLAMWRTVRCRSSGRSKGWRTDTVGFMSALKRDRRDMGFFRQIQALGHDCMVVAPALIPKRSGEVHQDEPARRGDAGAIAS